MHLRWSSFFGDLEPFRGTTVCLDGNCCQTVIYALLGGSTQCKWRTCVIFRHRELHMRFLKLYSGFETHKFCSSNCCGHVVASHSSVLLYAFNSISISFYLSRLHSFMICSRDTCKTRYCTFCSLWTDIPYKLSNRLDWLFQGIIWPQVITGFVANLINALMNYIVLFAFDMGVVWVMSNGNCPASPFVVGNIL